MGTHLLTPASIVCARVHACVQSGHTHNNKDIFCPNSYVSVAFPSDHTVLQKAIND